MLLELLSCVGYVVLFGLVFGSLGRSLSSRLSLAELAVNSVVSVSGLAGIALGAWVLRSKGVSVERIAKRSVLIFVLTSAVNVGAVVVIGMPMWLGLLPGSRNPLLTLLPAAGRAGDDRRRRSRWPRGRAARRLRRGAAERSRDGRADGAERRRGGRACGLIRAHDWRLLGAVGYWLFDNLVLYACLAAFGARAVVLGGRDGLPGGHARQLDPGAGRLPGGRRRAGGDAAAVRRASGVGGDRGGARSTARSRCGSRR